MTLKPGLRIAAISANASANRNITPQRNLTTACSGLAPQRLSHQRRAGARR
jgi:hypothetical protein